MTSLTAKYKPYAAYRPSGVEWLGEIPAHWEVRRTKELLIRSDSGIWNDNFADDGIPILRSTEQTIDGKWDIVDPARISLTHSQQESTLLQEGDLLITKSSGSPRHIGKTTLVNREVAEGNYGFSNFMQRIRFASTVNPTLMWWNFNCPVVRQQLVFLSTTTTGLGNLNREIIGHCLLPLPPLSEQRAIAGFLDRETARIDALIAKKERLIELLHEKRTALITRAVTRGLDPSTPMEDSDVEWLGEIPTHWEVSSVKHQYDVQLGKMLQNNPSSADDVEVPYLKALHVQWFDVQTIDSPTMWASQAEINLFGIKKGDLLVCEGGEGGRCGIVESNVDGYIIQNALHRVRPLGGSRNDFLQYVLSAISAMGWFDALNERATIAHFTGEKFGSLRIPLPPFPEQQAIATFLDQETARLDALVARVREAIDRMKELRVALISAAVTGRIDVREEAG